MLHRRFARTVAVPIAAAISLGACGLGSDLNTDSSLERQAENNGTALSLLTVSGVSCTGANAAKATFSGTIVTTGSVDSAIITLSVDGAPEVQVGVIDPLDWAYDGRYKSKSYAITSDGLGNGAHTSTLCFSQSGDQGRWQKKVCTFSGGEFYVACTPPPSCQGVASSYTVKALSWTSDDHITYQVDITGPYSSTPTLTISGPGAPVTASATSDPALVQLDNCKWRFTGTGAFGEYTFQMCNSSSSASCSESYFQYMDDQSVEGS